MPSKVIGTSLRHSVVNFINRCRNWIHENPKQKKNENNSPDSSPIFHSKFLMIALINMNKKQLEDSAISVHACK